MRKFIVVPVFHYKEQNEKKTPVVNKCTRTHANTTHIRVIMRPNIDKHAQKKAKMAKVRMKLLVL